MFSSSHDSVMTSSDSVIVDKSVSLEEELTCSICLELYKEPVSLPCLHSFCLGCLQKIHQKNKQPTIIECPQCRIEVKLDSGAVEELPRNFDLANIVAKCKLQQEDAKQRQLEKKKTMCPVHGKDIGLFCMMCYTLMCMDCFPEHKTHNVDSVDMAKEKCLVKISQ